MMSQSASDKNDEISDSIRQTLAKHGYQYLRPIGSGGFATVFLVHSDKYSEEFAVKRIEWKESDDKEFNTEIDTLLGLSHPLIIRMYEHFRDDDALYIVLEYCEGGSIKGLVQNSPLEPDKFWKYAKESLQALLYCHEKSIAHRDIKPDNMFIDKYGRVRLADFGLAHKFTKINEITHPCGSLLYVAPEVLKKKCVDPFAADVWSLGITFFYMAAGYPAFPTGNRELLIDRILLGHPSYPDDLSFPIRNLIQKMVNLIPKQRPTVAQILKMPVFNQLLDDVKIKKNITLSSRNSSVINMPSSRWMSQYIPEIKQPSLKKMQTRICMHAFVSPPVQLVGPLLSSRKGTGRTKTFSDIE
ncbi:CAMK family protein kinase [Tritrichomonas foetus]|uniref:CAMK family protein kinase n=1 Tax=Tritrichomonas foetus TaxID=1144522 RepID=A0A1J4JYD4_9EUKA|nr:CAMK family protein kinase [Tritrichomonas foetus]|eukprot:OHT02285.1 CAMK family protein kinase [Tritrichomonas foetus]